MSYVLSAVILLSQAGLPLHMHYCKGMLESVSVFFNAGCDNHDEIANLPACCQKSAAEHCTKAKDNCCDDEVKVLLQDFDSLLPHFDKWNAVNVISEKSALPIFSSFEKESPELVTGQSADSGPPIYILFSSLIFYA